MSSFEPLPLAMAGRDDFERNDAGDASSQDFVEMRVGVEPPAPEPVSPPSAEEIREQAYAEGFEAGRAELPWQEVEQVRERIEMLDKALAAVAQLRRDYLRDQRMALVDVALAVADKLVRRRIESDPEPLAEIVRRAVECLPDEEKLRVAVSSEDLAFLQSGLADDMARFGREQGVVLEASSELRRGDVRVIGERGAVDARVATLLARVRDGLAELQDLPEKEA